VLYHRPRGVAPGAAVPVRAAKLLEALEYLAEHNPLYNGDENRVTRNKINNALRKLRAIVNSAHFDPNAGAEEQKAVDAAAATYFTQGGPPPAGATVAELEKLTHSAAITTGLEARLFPHLFPKGEGVRPDSLPFASHARRRLLDFQPTFQQDADYNFYLLESWFRKNLSSATQVYVGASHVPGREAARRGAYALLGKVPGTTASLGQKRTQTVQMMKQLGRPHLFMTLTAHERQPWLPRRSKSRTSCAV